jgi:hypothetical protein
MTTMRDRASRWVEAPMVPDALGYTWVASAASSAG